MFQKNLFVNNKWFVPLYFFEPHFTYWIAEHKNDRTFFNVKRAQLAKHQMETVGAELRKNMLWGDDTDPDTASN